MKEGNLKVLKNTIKELEKYKKVLFEGHEMFRVGYTRLNIPWFFN
jgi:hypothetical protein